MCARCYKTNSTLLPSPLQHSIDTFLLGKHAFRYLYRGLPMLHCRQRAQRMLRCW